MITFHNDHLVSPVLCEILYHIVPECWHVPVVFRKRGDRNADTRRYPGACLTSHGGILRVEINLNSVLDCLPPPSGSKSFRAWYWTLYCCFHEYGHAADPNLETLPAGAYAAHGREYANSEALADLFAKRMIARLAAYDRRLCQPQWQGYVSIRLEKRFKNARSWEWGPGKSVWLSEVRSAKSGGQMTSGDVVRSLGLSWLERNVGDVGDSTRSTRTDTRIITRIASDLAFVYVDRGGRKHLLFAYGDLPEIACRVTASRSFSKHIATHPNSGSDGADKHRGGIVVFDERSGSPINAVFQL